MKRGTCPVVSFSPAFTTVNIQFFKMATKHSLEVTKGSSVIEPIPLDTSVSNSIDEGELIMPGPFPTEEEWATLPRVAGSIPWTAWTVAFVEFAERFSYYGTSAVCEFATFA